MGRRNHRPHCSALAFLCFLERRSLTVQARENITLNNAFASHVVLGHADGSWLGVSQIPDLHAKGLQGRGQVVGLGDTGIRSDSCSFSDSSAAVPYGRSSPLHRKIAGYFSVGGDTQDGPHGHGTHIAGSIAGNALGSSPGQPDNGVAPAARLVVVDVEKTVAHGTYNIPANSIGQSYFDVFRQADANVVCSPWSFPENAQLEYQVDMYVYNNDEFLPIFPSGNAFDQQTTLRPESPCLSKNVLCVGASYNARQQYIHQPSFVHTSLHLGSAGCFGSSRASCADEVEITTAIFGATAPSSQNTLACESAARACLDARASCPECAFNAARLEAVQDTVAKAASPSDACLPLVGFPRGFVCVVQRGGCTFSLKAKHCSEAGAVGVVIVNQAGMARTIMTPTGDEAAGLTLPVALISHGDGPRLLGAGRLLTFPIVSSYVEPHRRAQYSKYGNSSDGRAKPEIIVPGDGILSTAASSSCGFVQMSGTSQSCGIAAGTTALVREYLLEWADPSLARLANVWSSTLKAMLVAAAEVQRSQSAEAPVWMSEVGYGLPALAPLLPVPAGLGLVAVQSQVDASSAQTFCFALQPSIKKAAASVTIVWTDPPDTYGRLVNNLDLDVSCDLDVWKLRLGNGFRDKTNNVEKVVLDALIGPSSSGVCTVSVSASQLPVSPQKFSLVVAGPFKPVSECRTPSSTMTCNRGPECPCPQAWACRCPRPWVGPFCNELPETLPLQDTFVHRTVRPLQKTFYLAAVSCAGAYEFELQETAGSSNLVSAATWGNAEAQPPPSHGVVIRTALQGQRTIISVDVPASALRSGRSETAYSLRWRKTGASCPGSGEEAPDAGMPTELVVLVCVLAIAGGGLLIVSCFVAWRWHHRRTYARNIAPDPGSMPATGAPSSEPGAAWHNKGHNSIVIEAD
eukprot:TRINITY_DN31482_c0_g1_i1.p1 TRINITY_DN31482_c0_g1~~TRINITY_DN31482_c0_g1_i1.p1  ORF type:complete len:915 (-),score=124.90 TRINITY_DN31482_c0_g1_i1:278-3022(-)